MRDKQEERLHCQHPQQASGWSFQTTLSLSFQATFLLGIELLNRKPCVQALCPVTVVGSSFHEQWQH